MTSLHQAVRRAILQHELCSAGSRVVVALSGGSDSVALTLILRDLAEHRGFSLVALAHLNHRLRPQAAGDEQFCREFAGQLGLAIQIEATDVQAYADRQRLSVEDAARRVRYDFLHRVAAACGADRIAVGHTLDDQAETVLLKLIRGAGVTGLGGIHPRRGALIRPLLGVTRQELQNFLRKREQRWVEDDTNLDLANPRNRIRHLVLPELERSYGGPVRAAITRAAALLREDGQWLDELSQKRFHELTHPRADGLELDAGRLAAEPRPIARRVVQLALRTVAPDREIGFGHVEAALEVLTGACGAVDVPGSRVELRAAMLAVVRAPQRGAADPGDE